MNPQKGKILIVDDLPVFRVMLESMLEDYEVSTASSSAEAMTCLRSFHPDVILLDIELENSTGYDLCRTIRADSEFRFTKIVFVSSHTSLEHRLEGYAAGGDDYLSKPVNAAEVVAKIRVLMRLKTVEEVNQLKRGFLNLISHETMTPITVIQGFCDLLIKDSSLPQSAKDGLNSIHGAVDRLTSLVNKTILACSLEDMQHVQTIPLPVKSALGEACEGQRHAAAARGIEFKLQLEAASIAANPSLVGKALSYILENSVRFSPDNMPIEISGALDGASYRLAIRDHGHGIEPSFLSSVFDPFSVEDLEHHSRGSGLSLFLARRIVQLHHGTLSLANAAGGGAIAVLQMPLSGS